MISYLLKKKYDWAFELEVGETMTSVLRRKSPSSWLRSIQSSWGFGMHWVKENKEKWIDLIC